MAKFVRVNYYQLKERGCWGYVGYKYFYNTKKYKLFYNFFNYSVQLCVFIYW